MIKMCNIGCVLYIMRLLLLTLSLAITILVAIFLKGQPHNEMGILDWLERPKLNHNGVSIHYKIIGGVEIQEKGDFTITIDGKVIIRDAFMSCYSPRATVDSGGDSFYKINTQLIHQCKEQKITNVSWRGHEVLVQGFFQDCPDQRFTLNLDVTHTNLDLKFQCSRKSAAIWLYEEPEDLYFGLGEQFSYLSLGDRPYSLMVREKGVGRGDQPLTFLSQLLYGKAGTYYSSYSPVPIWISSRRLAYVGLTSNYLIWKRNMLVSWGKKQNIRVINNETYKELVGMISKLNGYTQPIPQWVNKGAILGLQGGSEKVQGVVQKLLENGAQISGVWLQDWVGKRMSLGYSRLWWNWELDRKLYPDWKQMRSEFERKGINLLIYMNPMLTDVANKSYYNKNYFQIAKKNGYLVKKQNDQFFQTSAFSDFTAGLIDLYNPQARQFYKNLVNEAIEQTGAKGMMVDFGESYPLSFLTSQMHNQYPVEWSKLVSSIISTQSDFFTFTRASYLSSPSSTRSLWAGDQNMNYGRHNGLPSCLTAMLTSGLVGFSNTHCDMGGYVYVGGLADRDRGLMQRWMGFAAFSPVLRTHQGNKPEKTLQVWDMPKEIGFWTKVYATLAPYRAEQAQISKDRGLPLVRAMFLQLENDSLAEIQDQYYLGDHILVAPLLSPQSTRSIYLPVGEWINLWTGTPQLGCNCYIEKSSETLPIAYVSSSFEGSKQLLSRFKSLRPYQTQNDQL